MTDEEIVDVDAADEVTLGVALPVRCSHPPTGKGVPIGLALAGALGSATSPRSPLVMPLAGVMDETFPSKKQDASPKRSSVKAKA